MGSSLRKQHLSQLGGLPPRFRQRLLFRGSGPAGPKLISELSPQGSIWEVSKNGGAFLWESL